MKRNPNLKTQNPKPKAQNLKANEQALNKVEAQIKMAEMELKMIEHEINGASLPEKLTELAAAHAEKIAEIDGLYLRWEELQC